MNTDDDNLFYLCRVRGSVDGEWTSWYYEAGKKVHSSMKSKSLDSLAEDVARTYHYIRDIWVNNSHPHFGVCAGSDLISKTQYDSVSSEELGEFIDLVNKHRKEAKSK